MDWQKIVEIILLKGYLWGLLVLIPMFVFISPIKEFLKSKSAKNTSIKSYSVINFLILIGLFIFIGYISYFLLNSMKISSFSPDYKPATNEQTILTVTDLAINRIYNILTITTIFFMVLIVPLGLFQFFKIREIDRYKIDFDEFSKKMNEDINNKLNYFENVFNADYYYSTKKYEEAKKNYEYIIDYNKKNNINISEKTYYRLAECYYNIGYRSDNIENLEKAISIINNKVYKYPKDILGLCYFSKGYRSDKIEDFEKSLEYFDKNTNDFDILIKKSYILAEKGKNATDDNEALEYCKESLRLLRRLDYEFKDSCYFISRYEIEDNIKPYIAKIYFSKGDITDEALHYYKYSIYEQVFDNVIDLDNSEKNEILNYILSKYIEECSSTADESDRADIMEQIGYLLEECMDNNNLSKYNNNLENNLEEFFKNCIEIYKEEN